MYQELSSIDVDVLPYYVPGESEKTYAALEAAINDSVRIWDVRDRASRTILLAGVFQFSLVGQQPNMWMIMCRPFKWATYRNLRMCRRLIDEALVMFPRLEFFVDSSSATDCKFAEFMGFSHIKDIENFRVYRKL